MANSTKTQALPKQMEGVRDSAALAISPLKPASAQVLHGLGPGFGAMRTKAGTKLPPYYLVYFLLVELLGYRDYGRSEKVDWSIPVELDGNLFLIEYRKLGLGIFTFVREKSEEQARRVVTLIEAGTKAAAPFFEYLAKEAVRASKVNVRNNGMWLFSRYRFLRDQFQNTLAEAKARKDEVLTEQRHGDSVVSTSYTFPAFRIREEAGWLGIAAIEAFFSWTEHILIHIAILEGKAVTGEAVAELANADWPTKFKTVLDISDPKTKVYFDELLTIRRQIRNYMAHGAFGKNGEAFHFHSRAGAVPVRLTERPSGVGFSILGERPFDEAAALSTTDSFIEHLWSGSLAPAKLYIQESGLDLVLPFATDGTYKGAMCSVDDMTEFLDYWSRQVDAAANMDW